jgi:hypothetical protein
MSSSRISPIAMPVLVIEYAETNDDPIDHQPTRFRSRSEKHVASVLSRRRPFVRRPQWLTTLFR